MDFRLERCHLDMTMKKCAFCQLSPPTVRITKEHLFRRWFHNVLAPGARSTILEQSYLGGLHNEQRRSQIIIPKTQFDLEINEICKKCNEGWLNDIEESSKDVLVDCAKGIRERLTQEDQHKLSVWAAKTAMVRALFDKGRRVIPSEHYVQLKDTQQPPYNTQVWVGFCKDYDIWTRHMRFHLFQDHGSIVDCHFTTLVLGHFLLIIFGASCSQPWFSTDKISTCLKEATNGRIRKIWPHDGNTLLRIETNIAKDEAEILSEIAFHELCWSCNVLPNSASTL